LSFKIKENIMGQPVEVKQFFTVEEYLHLETSSETRHEFYKNELFPIEATTRKHNEIVQNLLFEMRPFFRAKGCSVFTETLKVEAIKDVYYPYPDLVLTCDPDDTNPQIITSPILIVEVQSSSTYRHDHAFKWSNYRKMPSLRYYVMIAQDEISVELYSRKSNTSLWSYQEFTSLDDILHFELLDFQLDIKIIYDSVLP
jgi:Uma2 family endonuclease